MLLRLKTLRSQQINMKPTTRLGFAAEKRVLFDVYFEDVRKGEEQPRYV